MVGLAGAAAIVARPLIGRLMDSRGRRFVLLWGGAIHVVAVTAYLGIDAIDASLYAVRVLHGFAMAALFSGFFTVAADVAPVSRLTHSLAIFGISGMLPVSLAGLLGDLVLASGTYADLFVVAAALAAVALLVSVPIPETRPDDAAVARGFFHSARQPDLLPVWLVGLGFAIALSSYFAFLKTFVLDTGIGSVGTFFTAYAITAIVERVLLGWVPDRLGPKRTLLPSLLTLAAGLGALGSSTGPATLALAGVLCGAGHGFAFPVLSGLVVSRARPAERGAAISAFTALFDLGLLVGGPSLGLVVELAGHRWMFVVAAAVPLVAWAGFAAWDRRLPGGQTSSSLPHR